MELWVTELTQRLPRVWQDNPVIHSGRSTPSFAAPIRAGLQQVLMIPHRVAVAPDVDDVAVVYETVDESGGHHLVAKHTSPLLEALVGGQHCRRPLVASVDELEEEHGAVLVDRQVADLVDHQQCRMRQHAQPARQVAGGLGLGERLDQPCERAVIDAPAAAIARLIAKCVFPTPGGPSRITFSPRSRNPSSCRLSTCSRLMLGWKAKSNWSSVFTAGRREARMAVWRRRLLRSVLGYSRLLWRASLRAVVKAADGSRNWLGHHA